MHDTHSDNKDGKKDIICHCSGTTTGQITALVDKGIRNFETLSSITGAASGCGACESSIQDLLAEYL